MERSARHPSVLVVSGTKYTVKKLLGEGSYGFVYLVASDDGGQFALKRLLLETQEQTKDTQREIRMLKKLQGPNNTNVLTLVAYDSQSREAYLLTNFCSGGSLLDLMKTRLTKGIPFAEAELLQMFLQICTAVCQCHSTTPPIIHRDIKPENVFIEGRRYVLGDFGSCQEGPIFPTPTNRHYLSEDIETKTTMCYRSPEMCDLYSGKWIDEKSDIWALGCVLYKLAYLVTPFEDGGKLKIMNGAVEYPTEGQYVSFNPILKGLFEVDPDLRPDIDGLMRAVKRGLNLPEHHRVIPRCHPRAIPQTAVPPHQSNSDLHPTLRAQRRVSQPAEPMKAQNQRRVSSPTERSRAQRRISSPQPVPGYIGNIEAISGPTYSPSAASKRREDIHRLTADGSFGSEFSPSVSSPIGFFASSDFSTEFNVTYGHPTPAPVIEAGMTPEFSPLFVDQSSPRITVPASTLDDTPNVFFSPIFFPSTPDNSQTSPRPQPHQFEFTDFKGQDFSGLPAISSRLESDISHNPFFNSEDFSKLSF